MDQALAAQGAAIFARDPGQGGCQSCHGIRPGAVRGFEETWATPIQDVGTDSREAVPINLDPRWRNLATCVHRLDGRLLVILDVDALLGFSAAGAKAA